MWPSSILINGSYNSSIRKDVEESAKNMLMGALKTGIRINGVAKSDNDIRERVEKTKAFRNYIEQRFDELAEINVKDNYIPIYIAMREIDNSLYFVDKYLERMDESFYKNDPIGMVFAIPAFDTQPVQITVQGLGPWIHGNMVFLRSSRQVRNVGEFYKKALKEIEMDNFDIVLDMKGEDFIRLAYIASSILYYGKHLNISKNGSALIFSGTEDVWKKAYPYTKKFDVAVFNGPGNATAYVSSDADIEHAAHSLAFSSFEGGGQYCYSIKNILVDKGIFNEFKEAYLDAVNELKFGDPFDDGVVVGPIRNGAVKRLWSDRVKENNEKIVYGGKTKNERHRILGRVTYMEPTVFVHEEWKSLPDEEYFGPLANIIPVNGADEAIDMVKKSPYGLVFSYFGNPDEDQKKILHDLMDTHVGKVTLNHTMNDSEGRDKFLEGWGGFRKSGRVYDRRNPDKEMIYGGAYALEDIYRSNPSKKYTERLTMLENEISDVLLHYNKNNKSDF